MLLSLLKKEIERKWIETVLKDNAPFISCISKINDVVIENVEDLDVVMSMCNLLEYRKNYVKTFGSLWNHYRDELTDETNDNNGPMKNVINSKSFKYKTSITRNNYNVPRRMTKEVKISVPFKHLGNFLEQSKYISSQL